MWIKETHKGDFAVCGAHGRYLARFPFRDQADAYLKVHQLPTAPKLKVRVKKLELDILRRAAGDGIQYRAQALKGLLLDCSKKGWIKAQPTVYGRYITTTSLGNDLLDDAGG